MINVPVCIVGAGPIGLAAALLLDRFGIHSLIVERRNSINTHPRSRFVDTNTMELMRFFGVEKEVEKTGLGPDWTEYNRWLTALTKDQIAAIPSPSFHTVPRASSPTLPVMTCQDYVEEILLAKVRACEHVEFRYDTEAIGITQDSDQTTVTIKNSKTGAEDSVVAQYTLGTDGPHSFVRGVIESTLEAAPLATFSQDVIFEADLSDYVLERKGGLLYIAAPSGVLIFQPLNGITRWRCQIPIPTETLLSEEEAINRIREAVGTEDEVPITIKSMGIWQPTPGCCDRLHQGRVFLVGDAAHISVPTGGMGNNIGFAGARNLAWKLSFVLKGLSPPSILDTYEVEHRPVALERIDHGVDTTMGMMQIFANFYADQDTADAVTKTRYYADYDGIVLGFEMQSSLIAKNTNPPPQVESPKSEYVATIRAGRRAPHSWVNEEKGTSVLDWFGLEYVLVLGNSVDATRWTQAIKETTKGSEFPISCKQLPNTDVPVYDAAGLVLVRPDGIIADAWLDSDVDDGDTVARLTATLPLVG